MRYFIFVLFLLIQLITNGCSNNKRSEPENELDYLDLTIKCTASELKLSLVFDSILIIPLETTEECLINRVNSVNFYDSLIIVADRGRGVMVFSEKGKYLYNIGEIGRGPEEYTSLNKCYVNNELGFAYVIDGANKKLLRYRANGEFLSDISIPYHTGDFYVDSLEQLTLVSSFARVFIPGYFDILKLDSSADTIFFLSNQRLQTPGDILFETLYIPNFSFKHKEHIYIKRVFQDTLAYIDNNKLEPFLILDSKEFTSDFDDLYNTASKTDYNKFIIINDLVMLNDWLVINLNHQGSQYIYSYNTIDREVTKSYLHDEIFKEIPFPNRLQGLKNDLSPEIGSPWINISNNVYYSVLYPGKNEIPAFSKEEDSAFLTENPIIIQYK